MAPDQQLQTLQLDSVRGRALNYLSRGISPSQAALALGVSPALISQFLDEPEFSSLVAASRTEALSKQLTLEEEAEALEAGLLKQLKTQTPQVFDPIKIAAIYKIINGRQIRTKPQAFDESLAGAPTVVLSMPQVAVHLYTSNAQGQVVAVGNQSLVTLQAQNLDIMASQIKQLKGPDHEQAPSLPPSIEDFA